MLSFSDPSYLRLPTVVHCFQRCSSVFSKAKKRGYRNLLRVKGKKKTKQVFSPPPLAAPRAMQNWFENEFIVWNQPWCLVHQRVVLIFVSAFRWIAWRRDAEQFVKKKKKKNALAAERLGISLSFDTVTHMTMEKSERGWGSLSSSGGPS